ncbi:MAG TPA: outer membrane beta-barrel protein [Sphingobium sp.]|uniref:outer membrane protein n=1 Tax=Sphingobium sp. TaxID=1912891 RepID=UPI002ED38FD2
MQHKYSIIAALTAATAFTAVPAAADTGDRDTHFNGFYIGAGGGYDMQKNHRGQSVEFDTDRNGSFDNTVPTAAGGNAFAPGFCAGFARSTSPADGCSGDQDGGEFFGKVGYDRRMGNFVIGGVLEAGKTYAKDYTTAFSSTPAFYTLERGVDWTGSARLRAGYTPNGGILFYATGGGIYANMRHRLYTSNTANSFASNGKDGAWGYQVGGGIEAMVTRHISIGMEYLYTDINDDKSFYAVGAGTAPATNPFLLTSGGTNMRMSDQSFNYHAVRGSVNYRF